VGIAWHDLIAACGGAPAVAANHSPMIVASRHK
jgi:hypothetical protein